MRKSQLHYAAPLLALVALVLVGVFVYATSHQATAASPTNSSSSAPTTLTGTPPGIGANLVTAEGLSVTLERIDKQGTRWLFHFVLRNLNAANDATVIGSGAVHQFAIVGKTGPTTVVDKVLSTPLASEAAAGYRSLGATLKRGGATDGWLAVDTATLGFTPVQVIYRYHATSTTACKDPAVTSTCYPDTVYSMLIWSL